MDSSKVWINQGIQSRSEERNRKRKTEKRVHDKKHAAKQISSEGRARMQSNSSPSTPAATPSLLEAITTMAQSVDLVKLRSQITELNQIFDQVNGVIEKWNHIQRPPRKDPQREGTPSPKGGQYQYQYPPQSSYPYFNPRRSQDNNMTPFSNYSQHPYHSNYPYYPYGNQEELYR
jgi:hypothetical protein